MKIERTKNATRNILFGSAMKIYQLAIPFLMRTTMIYFMGVQYLGLNSLFASVLQVLNLAELGVGRAMIYSMYKPIAEDDTVQICALMKLYQFYYRIIGGVILGAGIILAPFVPHLIKGSVPSDVNVYVLYFLNLSATVLTYWLFAYKSCLLNAHQRNDVINKVMMVTSTLQYAAQFIILMVFKNYYLYVFAIIITQIIENLLTARMAYKMYPNYAAKGKLSPGKIHEINRRIKDLFTSKIGGVVVNSADTIVISAFLGLECLAIYQNYFYILNAVAGVITIAFSACTAGIGNSLVLEDEEKNYGDFRVFTLIIVWISGFCCSSLLCLYQPFMKLWVGESLMLNYGAVVCFSIYFYLMQINALLNLYKDAAGIWHQDRFRPLVTALANLIMNLALVQIWGLYGVILSTVISTLVIGMPWLLSNLFTTIFSIDHCKDYIFSLIRYTVVVFATCWLTQFICTYIHADGMLQLVYNSIVCVIVPNFVFILVFRKQAELKGVVTLIDHMTGGRVKMYCLLAQREK